MKSYRGITRSYKRERERVGTRTRKRERERESYNEKL